MNHNDYKQDIKLRLGFALFLVCLMPASIAQAQIQPPLNEASRQADRLIQEEQLRQEQRERERDAQRQQQESLLEDTIQPAKPEIISGAEQCSKVDEIKLTGVTLLSEKQQQAIVAPYLGQCLTLNDINRLLATITNYYFERGYVTSRAYIPAQNLSDGSLELIVIEGEIQSLDSRELTPLKIDTTFPTEAGARLNLRDLEQGLDQLNRLSSNQATLQLLPGKTPGATIVRIDNAKPVGDWRIATTLDNSGQESTGENQLGLSYSLNDPLGLADYMSLNAQTNAESLAASGTDSLALHYDIPLGYWNVDLDMSAFEYESQVQGFFSTFNTSGESDNQSLRVSRLWHRDQNSKFGNRLYLKRKKNLNFIEDVLLETSSRTLTSTSLETWYQYNLSRGSWNVALTYDKGLDAFGAENDDAKLVKEPLAEFTKTRLSAGFYWSFNTPLPLSYSANLSAQHSDNILYGAEQISIGSQYTVRGYKEQGASGNKGGYVRQELSTRLPAGPAWMKSWFGVWQLALGVDWGKIRDSNPTTNDDYTELSGWGIRVQSMGGPWSLSAEWARATNTPDYVKTESHDLYLSLGYHFQSSP